MGPLYELSIGSVFMDDRGTSPYDIKSQMPSEYDVVIWIGQSTPSALLPYNPPTVF